MGRVRALRLTDNPPETGNHQIARISSLGLSFSTRTIIREAGDGFFVVGDFPIPFSFIGRGTSRDFLKKKLRIFPSLVYFPYKVVVTTGTSWYRGECNVYPICNSCV